MKFFRVWAGKCSHYSKYRAMLRQYSANTAVISHWVKCTCCDSSPNTDFYSLQSSCHISAARRSWFDSWSHLFATASFRSRSWSCPHCHWQNRKSSENSSQLLGCLQVMTWERQSHCVGRVSTWHSGPHWRLAYWLCS